MTRLPEGPPSFSDLKSPFTKAIATRYYDGPLEGFLAHCDWSQACVFRLLDWDRETDLRVFEIARVEELEFEDAVRLLFRDRRRKTGQIQMQAPQQLQWISGRRRLPAFGFEPGQYELIDGIANPCFVPDVGW